MDGNTGAKRTVAFFGGCIGTRLLFAYAVQRLRAEHVRRFGVPLAVAAIVGWLYIMLVRPRDTGPETFGGHIWWQWLRPVHVLFYAAFVYLAFQKPEYAHVPLFLDVLLAFTAVVVYRFLWH